MQNSQLRSNLPDLHRSRTSFRLAVMSLDTQTDWQALCAAKKQRQLLSIPEQWKLTPPVPDEERRVLDIPRTSGLLTARELEITDTTNIHTLLNKLHSAEWSSVEVTTAFYKRAVIAQQLVCLSNSFFLPMTRPTPV